jgi:MoxR-like ATPase
MEYMVDIVSATRTGENVLMGVSPRGTLAFLRCVKAYAYLQGRTFVTPDDVKALAVPVLAHRIVMGYGRTGESREFVKTIVEYTVVPTEEYSR